MLPNFYHIAEIALGIRSIVPTGNLLTVEGGNASAGDAPTRDNR